MAFVTFFWHNKAVFLRFFQFSAADLEILYIRILRRNNKNIHKILYNFIKINIDMHMR